MSYETIIGLEIHAELSTKTKIFCNCSTEFGAKPNANTCPICLGLPGTLPVINEEVVRLAVKAGKALNCEINNINKMDRKNYFYPDLPKAFQTSQFDLPICKDGYVEISVNDKKKKVRLNRIHMEEDAGKLVHLEDEPYSLIDYNRVGVPLIEIVSEPDMSSPEEAVAYAKALKEILEYSEISDCKMEQGSLRVDANISLREVGEEKLNTKVEIKNINSFKELQKALEKEQKRQLELYTYGEGHKVKQETRRWDSAKGRTIPMRSKEDAHDYRYFPEPDLVPVILSDEYVEEVKSTIPELPEAKRERFIQQYGLSQKEVDVLVSDKPLAEFFEGVIEEGANAKASANWVLGDLLRVLKEKELTSESIPVKPKALYKLISIIEEGQISNTAGKEVFEEMCISLKEPEVIVEEKRLKQISGTDEIEKIVIEIISQNPQSVEDYKNGKKQAAGFLMGQVMKATKGKANPKVAKELIEEKLKSM